jgi:hypothetical protein
MSGVHCFTSISFSYLDRARILAETVKRFHPEWTLWLCVSDREPEGFHFDLNNEQFDRILWIQDLGIAALKGWIFRHDVVELCTAVKGRALLAIFEAGASKVIYLDPDISLFNDMSDVVSWLDRHPIVLTPHICHTEKDEQAITDNEIGTLKHGTYNLGFIAVNDSEEGLRFARWWSDRLLHYCYDDIASGIFTDQRWCDLVPGLFDRVKIVRDPGYNVASWNLGNRPITIETDGTIYARGHRLRFFHFTKVDTVGEIMLTRYARSAFGALELLKWYRGRLATHALQEIPPRWWAFSTYDDGEPILREHRLLYRESKNLRQAFPDPFSTHTTENFRSWYEQYAQGTR